MKNPHERNCSGMAGECILAHGHPGHCQAALDKREELMEEDSEALVQFQAWLDGAPGRWIDGRWRADAQDGVS